MTWFEQVGLMQHQHDVSSNFSAFLRFILDVSSLFFVFGNPICVACSLRTSDSQIIGTYLINLWRCHSERQRAVLRCYESVGLITSVDFCRYQAQKPRKLLFELKYTYGNVFIWYCFSRITCILRCLFSM